MGYFSGALTACFAIFSSVPALANSESYPWQQGGYFSPYSNTAEVMTGPLMLSPTPSRVQGVTRLELAFEYAMPTGMSSLGVFRSEWIHTHGALEGEIFELDNDPGELRNGETLCRGNAKYVMITSHDAVGVKILSVAVFDGNVQPNSISENSLCGVFNFNLPKR